jgi:hypothetical protein
MLTEVTSKFDPCLEAKKLLETTPELGLKIGRATFCSLTETPIGLAEVLKFLSLAAAEETQSLTPSRRVDLVWHELILFTRLYQNLCTTHFGRFIHHEPAETHVSCTNQYHATLDAYAQRFGPLDPLWWDLPGTPAAHCGSCESIT